MVVLNTSISQTIKTGPREGVPTSTVTLIYSGGENAGAHYSATCKKSRGVEDKEAASIRQLEARATDSFNCPTDPDSVVLETPLHSNRPPVARSTAQKRQPGGAAWRTKRARLPCAHCTAEAAGGRLDTSDILQVSKGDSDLINETFLLRILAEELGASAEVWSAAD